ncbi:response regulator transcription factor [Thalassomonas actiniarum]|uniref:Response regulator transcription factor n=1 Tax=Thalassomonas actiniarum TaxID=485447 RepID=A0AAF0C5J5_9GAMM|nr:response regulator transcription factor [Thalassomonas actiniarum]WDE01618.1 response regulator transcription factor [Thalassomonas actiniarum]
MNKKPRLLIVEDEISILHGLTDLFVYHGFDVATEQDGNSGLAQALTGGFDCIILDVMLPGLDGFSICNAIRKASREQPVVMLTAKSSEEDIINGLTLGADDYIAKPFSVQELVLRIKTILRRSGWHEEDDTLELGEHILIDVCNLSGTVYGKQQVFTRREVDILSLLYRRKRPVPRSELLTAVWGYSKTAEPDTRTVDIHIAKLRKKIELNARQPKILVTFRGEGYKLVL